MEVIKANPKMQGDFFVKHIAHSNPRDRTDKKWLEQKPAP